MTRAALLAFVVAGAGFGSTAAAASADEEPAAKARLEQSAELGRRADDTRDPVARVSAWTNVRVGVVAASYPSETLGEVRSEAGQARLFRLGAAMHATTHVWLGVHAAYVWAGVEQPAGAYRAGSAWGNPMVFARLYRPNLWLADRAKLDGELSLSLGVPIAAERGEPYEQLDRRTLAIGNALEGLTNPEIFTPDVFPMAPSGSLVFARKYLEFSMDLELPLLLRLSDDTIPDGASTSAVGFIPNAEVRGTAWPWTWLGLSLGGSVAWPLVEPVYLSTRRSEPQLMLTPRVAFALGTEVLLAMDVGIAAGGPADGTLSAALSARLAL